MADPRHLHQSLRIAVALGMALDQPGEAINAGAGTDGDYGPN